MVIHLRPYDATAFGRGLVVDHVAGFGLDHF